MKNKKIKSVVIITAGALLTTSIAIGTMAAVKRGIEKLNNSLTESEWTMNIDFGIDSVVGCIQEEIKHNMNAKEVKLMA